MNDNACWILSIVCALCACSTGPSAGAAPVPSGDKPHVVFVLGTPHYSPEKTLPPLAEQLARSFPFRVTVVEPDYDPERNAKGIEGLDVLDDADLAVFFLRFLTLPEQQMAHVGRYVTSGKPVIGLRTSTHAFLYPDGHKLEKWNNGFGQDVLGSRYYLHMAGSTDVRVAPEARRHPILSGFPEGPVTAAGSLYRVGLPEDARPLLLGTGKPKRTGTVTNMFGTHELAPVETSPVAWTWKNQWGGRVFATTFGHVETFENEWMVRLLINAIHWAADVPVPDASAQVAPIRLE